MKLAVDMPELLNSNRQTSSDLNLNQALELLSAPEEVKTEVTAKIEAGEDVTIKEIQALKKQAAELTKSKPSRCFEITEFHCIKLPFGLQNLSASKLGFIIIHPSLLLKTQHRLIFNLRSLAKLNQLSLLGRWLTVTVTIMSS